MSQYQRVKAVLETATKPLALHDIRKTIWVLFRKSDSEAAISARIRDIRNDLMLASKGRTTIVSHRAAPGKAHHLYSIAGSAGA